MTLPTIWQLLLPSFSLTTLVGLIMILLGIFNNIVLAIIGKLIGLVTGGKINGMTIRITLIGSGIIMVWLPSIIKDLWASTDGKLIMVAIVTFIILILVMINHYGKDNEKTKIDF